MEEMRSRGIDGEEMMGEGGASFLGRDRLDGGVDAEGVRSWN